MEQKKETRFEKFIKAGRFTDDQVKELVRLKQTSLYKILTFFVEQRDKELYEIVMRSIGEVPNNDALLFKLANIKGRREELAMLAELPTSADKYLNSQINERKKTNLK